jgi:DNA excision repair protein ERCC-6
VGKSHNELLELTLHLNTILNYTLCSRTPIQNDLRELWSLFDFIFPGRLGTLPAFEAEFAAPIKRGGYSNASPMQVQLAYRCSLVLRDLINPYLLRRQKKDVKEVNRMPGKTEQVLFCRLSPKQRRMYEEFLRSDEVLGVMRGSANLLGAVTTLRKICNHASLVANFEGTTHPSLQDDSSSTEDEFYEGGAIADQSGKLQVLSKILPLWKEQGHKVIIFTQWRKMLNIIERFTNMQGWKYARMDGNTSVSSRQRLVDKFNNDESYFCMLMTTKTGGVGLNITGANRVLLYDPDWNPQTDAQARERAWRFGQKRDVTVYRLITAGTIEEKIYQRQIFKTALSNQVLQDPKQRRLFSQKDLRDLFTLKADTDDITETGEITRGKGVVDVNIPDAAATSENNYEELPENSNTLEVVMKSKGLCGVFDHDFVENSSSKKKSMSEIEMENDAKKTALKAVASLQESSRDLDRFTPTWTGSDETRQPPPAAASAATKMTSSSALLANLQQKRMQIASSSQKETNGSDSESKKHSELLLRLRNYLRRRASSNGGGPTTRELLKEFKDVPDSDAAVFRKMLKSIAVIRNGQWILQ